MVRRGLDKNKRAFEIDSYGALKTVGRNDSILEDGRALYYSGKTAALGAAAVVKYLFIPTSVATTHVHFYFDIQADQGNIDVLFAQSCTIATSGTGTALALVNRNRVSTLSCTCALYGGDCSTTAAGTTLIDMRIGAVARSTGNAREASEFILVPGAPYLLQITANQASLTASIELSYYAHVD